MFTKKYVAVLDVRSQDVTAAVGERGVNNTFIIKSRYTAQYDGYAEGEFLDKNSFAEAVGEAVKRILSAVKDVKTFYVGVPGEFTMTVNTEQTLTFRSNKRITRADCESLASDAAPEERDGYIPVKHSSIYYVLADKRKITDPVGETSDSLHGKFSYFLCSTDFIDEISGVFEKFTSVRDIELIPSIYAQSLYLVEPERRDECAVLFDFGYISSTYSVIYGNGVLYSESFSIGLGHVALYLSEELEIPYGAAMKFLPKVNLNAGEKLSSIEECEYDGKIYAFSSISLRSKIREGLDAVCEAIEVCKDNYTVGKTDLKPVLLTGEGVGTIRGTAEHISNRLVRNVEIISPRVPYYDKPQFSSLFSLLDCALRERERLSFFSKLF